MIVEHARVVVRPGQGEAFERAVAEASRTVFPRAQGFRALSLHRCVEQTDAYVCVIEWDTLEAHTVAFRGGPLFAEWRTLVGPHFAEPPTVLHYQPVSVS